jgi:GH35 family endo-1,4-beta-xylanase
MKYNKTLINAALALLVVGMSSCYDEKMNWEKRPNDLTTSELPLQLQEQIDRYEALNTYTNFTLGVGIDRALYMSDETYRNTVNENFDEITVGYDMKHGAMVNAQGALNFTNVDALIAKLKEAGLTVYGHTLAWHTNQNAGYLNSLIAPQIIPSAGESQLDVTALSDGSFTGWSRNNAAGISIVQNAGLSGNEPAIRFETTTAGNEWDTQLTSPEIPAVVDHHYKISFWTKSEDTGGWRMSFAGFDNNYPWNGGGALFTTGSSWTQITYEQVAVANAIKIAFDLGKVPGVYFVDLNSISVIDLDAAPSEINLVENGDFESGQLGNWSANNPGAGITVAEEAKHTGAYGAKLIASSTSANDWDLQLASPSVTLDANKTYTFSFYIKSDVTGAGRISFPGSAVNEYPWMDWTGSGAAKTFTTPAGVWTFVSVELSGETNIKLSFDLGTVPDAIYYLDDVKVVEKAAPALRGTTVIEKSDEEKAQIISAALEKWISQMVGHYKNDVHSWDVVNEPMDDAKPSALKTGAGKEQASDEFYWQDYLGKDYAVRAFNLARQYGNATDKLFINDYNLEQNLAKCDGLIEYVKYIESKGATIDGVGTQMHISITSSKDNIDQMFRKLAATGKLIKISELDIKVGTASPTSDDYAAQAEMYRYVMDAFREIVPEAQRYGATVWCVSDNADEHVNWIPDDAPCLWDAKYARKHAYKGFADGLAGKDVGAEFPGDLQY